MKKKAKPDSFPAEEHQPEFLVLYLGTYEGLPTVCRAEFINYHDAVDLWAKYGPDRATLWRKIAFRNERVPLDELLESTKETVSKPEEAAPKPPRKGVPKKNA